MPNSTNPYHVWLGLPPELTSPNYYQLLGIEPTLRDRQLIVEAAKKQLARLKQVDPGKHHAVLEKIQKRVQDAHAVLTHETKRAAYDQKLLAALTKRAASASAEEGPTSVRPAVRPDRSVQSPTRGSKSRSRSSQVRDKTAGSSRLNRTEQVSASGSASSRPESSIPMAMPVQSEDQPSVAPGEEEASLDSIGVKPRKHLKKRRSKNPLAPIIGGILFLIAACGTGYVLMNLESLLGANKPVSEKKAITAAEVARELAKQNNKVKKKKIAQPPSKQQPQRPMNTDPDSRTTSLGNSAEANVSDTWVAESDVNTEPLSFEELVRLRRHLTNAQRAMFRRDKMTADNELANAQSLFLRFHDDPALAIDPDQAQLERMVDHTENIKQLLEGFWRQVMSSIPEIPGGQSIDIGSQTIAFVEGQIEQEPRYIILRVGGENIRYAIEHLPAGIAKAIAEQGSKQDLPTWRMQRAAFYAVHRHLDPKYKELAMDSAAQAAADGHDEQPIVEVVHFEMDSFGVPDEKIELPDEETAQDEMNELVSRLGINDIRRMRPEQALPMIDSLVSDSIATEDPDKRVIRLMAAYYAARQSKDAYAVSDVLDEMELWSKFPKEDLLVDAMVQIGRNVKTLNANQARRFCEVIIRFAKQSIDRSVRKAMIGRAQKAANHHQMLDLQRRLKQLE